MKKLIIIRTFAGGNDFRWNIRHNCNYDYLFINFYVFYEINDSFSYMRLDADIVR